VLTSLLAALSAIDAGNCVKADCGAWSPIATDASADTRLVDAAHLNPGIAIAAVRQPSNVAASAPTATAQIKDERIIFELVQSVNLKRTLIRVTELRGYR
jgi:hypothetical protein